MIDPSPPPRTGLDRTFDMDAPPRVAGSNSLWPVAFGIVGALGLGAVVFLQLEAGRTAIENAALASRQAAADAAAQRLAAATTEPSAIPPPGSADPASPEPLPPDELAVSTSRASGATASRAASKLRMAAAGAEPWGTSQAGM